MVVKLPVTVTEFCSIILSVFVTVPWMFVEPLPLMLLAKVPAFRFKVPEFVVPLVI